MSEQQPPRFDPQTGQPLYSPPPSSGMKPGVVGLIAVVAAVIGLGIGALLFNGGDDSKDASTITAPGRTTDVTISTPGKTVTNTETQVQTVTVNTTEDNTGGDTP